MIQTNNISKEFKKNTLWAILSILLFIIVYILLVSLSIVLTLFCGYAGVMIIFKYFNYLTILLGIALIGLGLLILIFLIKFLFKKETTDRSNYIEVTRYEEPLLFSLIDSIVEEVGTDFP